VALGVGWNFLFVGATTLLTRTYTGAERGKVQAFNDFLVFRHRNTVIVRFARDAIGRWLDHGADRRRAVRRGRGSGGAAATRAALRCYILLSPCKQVGHDAP
jgi:hypothetical protein